ncbi:twin-arginine translocation proteinsubunit TatB [Thioalkalivibrio versutus]|uniref:Sec-independent protein translocase protein TatB n=1 Tax=Thioalkalivibrio versutus TaxID=106634 RepID=A0A0G3G529_9GAMM|nr:Sec-independent protein translocase protein TatB [Thioalkalivibrio versutus]AKJ96355.1 twin-arginine translocation proteinsubunit TatB [Thioalkalivibrio versutus]
MFDIGFWEIIIIVLVALLVVGPERLPGLAREIGRWVGKTRRFVHSVRSDFEQELQTDELRNMLKSQDREIRQLKNMMDETETSLREDIEDTERDLREDIEGKPKTRKDLSGKEQKALAENKAKPAVRDKPSMRSPDASARASDTGAPEAADDADVPEVRRVPTQGDLDGNLMTDDPALAAEQKARASDGPRPERTKPAVRERRTPDPAESRGGEASDPEADTTHNDQTPDKHS